MLHAIYKTNSRAFCTPGCQVTRQDHRFMLTLLQKINALHRAGIYLTILRHFFLKNMVLSSVLGKLRMRKKNTKIAVPLDAVPERRTKRFPSRFRPVGRFSEVRFRYQSSPTGSEGEISRPLDHRWQIPFIHSTRSISNSIFCIYSTAF